MNREQILQTALRCVLGDRQQDYGEAEDNFRTIAEFWETYLRAACVTPGADVCINPEDVAAMMILLKVARISSGHAKEDNWVDISGYAACGGELDCEINTQKMRVDGVERPVAASVWPPEHPDIRREDCDTAW